MKAIFNKQEWGAILLLLLLSGSGILLYGIGYSHAEKATIEQVQPEIGEPAATEGDSLLGKDKDYVGPPEHLVAGNIKKFSRLVQLDLNQVDSLTLLRVPGIGPAFARRILQLRQRLGGYYTTKQLQEVYGMDEDKYLALRRWFTIQTPPKTYPLEQLEVGALPDHLYLSYRQKRAMERLINRYGKITSWQLLRSQSEFSRDDSIRLSHYFVESH